MGHSACNKVTCKERYFESPKALDDHNRDFHFGYWIKVYYAFLAMFSVFLVVTFLVPVLMGNSFQAFVWAFSLCIGGLFFVAVTYSLRIHVYNEFRDIDILHFKITHNGYKRFESFFPEAALVNKKPHENGEKTKLNVFSQIYGFLASLAITQALISYYNNILTNIPSSNMNLSSIVFEEPAGLIYLMTFFVVAIPIIHAGFVLLSNIMNKTEIDKPKSIIAFFVFSIIQISFLFFAAKLGN